jgi:orotidine-5'-phosphate decarboxylase
MLQPKDRIILALDVDTLDEALALIDKLGDSVGLYKVGLQMLTKTGPSIFREIRRRFPDSQFFYDAKFHDIPNTVGNAVRNAADVEGIAFVSVHVAGGLQMMQAAMKDGGGANILGITALTSLDDTECQSIFSGYGGQGPCRKAVVEKLTRKALDANLDGIVCSPNELSAVKQLEGANKLVKVVPGIRPAWAQKDDQKSFNTPGAAITEGADYLVIGRPIRQPPEAMGSNPRKAAEAIASEIEEALLGNKPKN